MGEGWHARAVSEVIEATGASPGVGLGVEEAGRRLASSGPNALHTEPGPGPLRRLGAQLSDVTVLALLASAVLAVVLSFFGGGEDEGFLERYGDAVAICAIVVLNAVIGLVQEQRAEQALSALRSMTAPSARVLRAGVPAQVSAAELVVGDIVVLGEGDRVPADLRLVSSAGLRVMEAALTGESAPVDKPGVGPLAPETPLSERSNMAFSGTHVTLGRGEGVVVATGMETELGRIAGMLASVEIPDTPLKRSLRRFGQVIVVACVAVSAVVFGVGMLQSTTHVPELLLTAVSLAVAAIPEGLPAITTIVLALGVQRMARRQAIVRHLPAVESLGCAQVICTDKTGTLTQNRMVVRRLCCAGEVWEVEGDFFASSSERLPTLRRASGEAADPLPAPLRRLLHAAWFAPQAHLSHSDEGGAIVLTGDATDGALLLLADRFEGGAAPGAAEEFPFDHERMMSTSVVDEAGASVAYTHGAPEAVLKRCVRQLGAGGETVALDQAALVEVLHGWADAGLRVLAIGARALEAEDEASQVEAVERELVLLGLVAIADPPRVEVAEALRVAQGAGVRTMMITGDHPRTAEAIARELGLGVAGEAQVLAGPELDGMSDEALVELAPRLDVVARATAEHKLRIIHALTRGGAVAAMTGDGVNDAPAIKAATIGIAMGRDGTDVAREAADLVLADDNYATIVAAIEEGRIIYDNIKKFIMFLLCINTGLVLAVFVASLLGWPSLLTPTQILWINLITNGLPALALGVEPIHPDPMQRPPRSPSEPLLSVREYLWMACWGVLMAAAALGVFAGFKGYEASDGLAVARSMTFTVLAIMPLFHAFNMRNPRTSLFQMGLLSNRALLLAGGVALGLQALALYMPGLGAVFHTTPLGWAEVLLALGLSAAIVPLAEVQKMIGRWLAPARGTAAAG